MCSKVFNEKLNYFGGVLTKDSGVISNCCHPHFKYDYSYIITGFKGLTSDIKTALIKANLIAEVKELLPNTSLIQLKQFGYEKNNTTP